MTDEQATADKVRKERSPSFPFISLKRAVERAQEMAEAHRRSPSRLPTVGETWGYGAKSSGLLQTVAAMKAFGLIEDMGGGNDRRIQVSDLAWRILHDARPNAKEQAIREAAVKPRLIAEYAGQWIPERPSDSHCLSELQLDRGFTADAAKLFLRVFDETVSFANLKEGDSLSPSFQQETSGMEATPETGFSPLAEMFRRSAPAVATVPPPTLQTLSQPFTMQFGPGRISGAFNIEFQDDVDQMIQMVSAMKVFLKKREDAAN
ncbi:MULTISPECIES: hypothetical protein [unclassified Bradyrhizobium]|uniref:hypothetical protein n=1 Tax=unclassified Bradyrhizobium TaxID=2631580 RepID=UPI001FFB8E00|nr:MULTISPECIES: hypothetical protein [unclassified Bradyrhizobium]MCK1532846.1 hypothetical protein [Bradyrhizobium sp. 176]MCK1559578.1 hypothetical protein [Bradyrhizobium sp. 171]